MLARSKVIGIATDFADDRPEILADGTQIRQVTFNLMRNGIDAVEQAERREVLVSTRSDRAGGAHRGWGPIFASRRPARCRKRR